MLETAIIISLVVGITEVFKRAFLIPKRFIPLVSLILGISITFIFRENLPITEVIYIGIFVGLSGAGLYSSTKATIKG
jgi:hypothetical protein